MDFDSRIVEKLTQNGVNGKVITLIIPACRQAVIACANGAPSVTIHVPTTKGGILRLPAREWLAKVGLEALAEEMAA